jgi:hypothetical protein
MEEDTDFHISPRGSEERLLDLPGLKNGELTIGVEDTCSENCIDLLMEYRACISISRMR